MSTQHAGLHSICLTSEEKELFRVFLAALKWKGRMNTTLRVAGGWVRDKLLGKDSNDIDIAIDDQTGVEFATSLNEYLQSIGIESHRLAVILANPEQSKHIETATVKVLGIPIDFVNLRSETYSEDSRIPGITFGTAAEDAFRRDFTINSLFYNINTEQVEDLTQQGLSDLMAGVMRTPLDPLVTFKDDPLRILRAVRFAARFAFSLDDSLVQAARTPEVHLAFDNKVSRERMLKELDGMLAHHVTRPALALMYIHYIGIYHLVFKFPGDVVLPVSSDLQGNNNSSSLLEKVKSDADSNVHAAPAPNTHVSTTTVFALTQANKTIANAVYKTLDTVYWVNILRCIRSAGWNNEVGAELAAGGSTDDMELDAEGVSRIAEARQAPPAPAVENGTRTDGSIDIRASNTIEPRCISVNEQCRPLSSTGQSRSVYFAAATNMLRDQTVLDSKKKEVSVPTLLLKDSLKMDTDTIKAVQAMHEAILSFQDLAVRYASFTREEGGVLLRSVRENWREALWIACADQLAGVFPRNYDIPPPSIPTSNVLHTEKQIFQTLYINVSSAFPSTGPVPNYVSSSCTVEYDTIIQFALLEQRLLELQLDRVWELKPLLDGNQLMQAVGLKRGPLVGMFN